VVLGLWGGSGSGKGRWGAVGQGRAAAPAAATPTPAVLLTRPALTSCAHAAPCAAVRAVEHEEPQAQGESSLELQPVIF
jgi:hypothetical protein